MELIKTFKFTSNLEYVHSLLNKRKIAHSIDIEKVSLYSDDMLKSKILKIVDSLNLDESEVKSDDNVFEGDEEWNKNMYNPGYFTGGKVPSFTKNKSNYLSYGLINLVVGLVCLIQILSDKTFSKGLFWFCVMIILAISGSMFFQFYKFKKRKI